MTKGIFTISLDFELHWGGFEKWQLPRDTIVPSGKGMSAPADAHSAENGGRSRDYQKYFLNTRQVIPRMLALFKKYETHVTWATVGMLLHRSKEELLENAPALKPGYEVRELSAYHYITHQGIGEDESVDPFHYAPSLVQQILSTPSQELGTHTFSHFYCNEKGQQPEEFREDLKAARRAAANFGMELRSLVFPRNQFNDQYLRICFEEGIRAVRSNPSDWFWKIDSTEDESAWKRLNRGIDAYFALGNKTSYALKDIPVRPGFPVCLPASRLLRPYDPAELFLNRLKLQRIMSEMERAARRGEVYHLWWHPHNFGDFPDESLKGLETILQHFRYCADKWNMQSLNMGEVASVLRTAS